MKTSHKLLLSTFREAANLSKTWSCRLWLRLLQMARNRQMMKSNSGEKNKERAFHEGFLWSLCVDSDV